MLSAIWTLLKWGTLIYLLITDFPMGLMLTVVALFFKGGCWLHYEWVIEKRASITQYSEPDSAAAPVWRRLFST